MQRVKETRPNNLRQHYQIKEYINIKRIVEKRIFDDATAKASSEMNLHSQYLMFSDEEFAKPSAVLNSVCKTSPPKFWHNLSNICQSDI